jgi:hypothetical protein
MRARKRERGAAKVAPLSLPKKTERLGTSGAHLASHLLDPFFFSFPP